MAVIATDAHANGDNGDSGNLTFAHTCTGSNLILWVAIDTAGTTDIVAGVTYNSVAMTRTDALKDGSTGRWIYLYYLIAPATGAHNVVVDIGNAAVTCRAASSSYTGAQQSGVPDAHNTTSADTVTSITLATTTIADNCWVVSAMGCGSGLPSAGTGLTVRDTSSNMGIGDNNAAKTPAGSVSLTWNLPSGNAGVCNASFAPATAVAATIINEDYAYFM